MNKYSKNLEIFINNGIYIPFMDEKDRKILLCLQEHGRWGVQRIAKETRIPITTVYHRMKSLEKEGIIKNYTIEVDYKKIGIPLVAYVLVVVDYRLLKEARFTQYELAQKILKEKGVESAAMVTGGTDIVLKIRVATIDELNQFITVKLRNIDGIERTQTMIVLNEAEK